VADRELAPILDISFILLLVGVDICKFLELFLDSAEFDPTLGSTVSEDWMGHREHAHQIEQLLLLNAMAHGVVVSWASLVALSRFEAKQNLIVSKEIRAVKCEVLILILVRKRKRYSSLKHHEHLTEEFSFLDDRLISDEHSAVEARDKVADELLATLQLLATVVIRKQVVEVYVNESLEKLRDKFWTKLWLKLVEEFVAMCQFLVVMSHWFLNVISDFLVENSRQRFWWARVVELHKPYINLFKLTFFRLITGGVDQENIVDWAHNEGEESNTDKLYEHIE
jgi:hypothetical protein